MMGPVGKTDVAVRAYQIWESEGRPEGQDVRHWLRAEAEVAAAALLPVKNHHKSHIGRDIHWITASSYHGPRNTPRLGSDDPLAREDEP